MALVRWEKAFVNADWVFNAARLPYGSLWTLCNANQKKCIDEELYIFVCENSQNGRQQYEIIDADRVDGATHYRYQHIFNHDQRHLIVRPVAFGGSWALQYDCTSVADNVKKIDVFNMSGTKLYTDVFDSDQPLRAYAFCYDLQRHLMIMNRKVSSNVSISLFKAGDDPTEIKGNVLIINPRDERQKRARTGQTKLCKYFRPRGEILD
jgi:hypothetical protein